MRLGPVCLHACLSCFLSSNMPLCGKFYTLQAFTHQMCFEGFFCANHLHETNNFWIVDWTWVFSHRIWKVTITPANKCDFDCCAEQASVSPVTTSTTVADRLNICVSLLQVLFDKHDTNYLTDNICINMYKYRQSVSTLLHCYFIFTDEAQILKCCCGLGLDIQISCLGIGLGQTYFACRLYEYL